MIREYVNKGKTVASIAVFFALVRPDTQPPMWVMALLVIGAYEAILFGIRVDRQLRQAKRRKRNERIRRLADEGCELMDKRLKNISMAEAVSMASNPGAVVYMIQRVYGETTVEQLCAADGFYIIEEQEPEKTEKQPEKKHNVKQVDHAKIVALYTADPPRSVGWIANDMGISDQTVVNHLKKEGLWPKKEET